VTAASGETIFALSSAAGPAAVAVVRLSGPGAGGALAALSGGKALPEPRRAALRTLVDPATGERLDQALVLWFAGPASETGEDLAELHLHGSPAVVEAVLDALGRLPGLRPAEPGEFLRRSFLNGKLDLTAVEGIADLIAAETPAQRRQALAQAEGALARRAAAWRESLVGALAELEAAIDFVEDDLPADLVAHAVRLAGGVAGEIAGALAEAPAGERLRQGLRVALLGAPNAGKSSLLNTLAGRAAAIVAATPGTTRDVLEVPLHLAGLPVTLVDTAGLRTSHDPVEAEGVRRAETQAATADLRLYLQDSSVSKCQLMLDGQDCLVIATKTDLPAAWTSADALPLSVVTGQGLDRLRGELGRRLQALVWSGRGEAPLVTRSRQRAALEETLAALHRAAGGGPIELIAEEFRLALRGLGRLAGRVDVEELLDRIFAEFCIGK
jgi:tRNA modification GTPase